jgi:hypothetical protein
MATKIETDDMTASLHQRLGNLMPFVTALPAAVNEENRWIITDAPNLRTQGQAAKSLEFPFIHDPSFRPERLKTQGWGLVRT